MRQIAELGTHLKKIYRIYSQDLLSKLEKKGYIDLRPSFLEILSYLAHHSKPSIKEIGKSCHLKKQTMTSHLNELEKRGYILREQNPLDKRQQQVLLTEYGETFRLSLLDSMVELEASYNNLVGEVEMERVLRSLEYVYAKISNHSDDQAKLI